MFLKNGYSAFSKAARADSRLLDLLTSITTEKYPQDGQRLVCAANSQFGADRISPSDRTYAGGLRFAGERRISPKSNGQRKAIFFTIVIAFALMCVVTPKIFSQGTEYGQINGTVTDPAGHVITNAKVTATNVATNIASSTTTNASGLYRISNLLPAQYSLSIEAPGFKTVTIEAFKLNVGEALTQNRSLPIGDTAQKVVVTAQGQLLQTTTVGNSTTIQEKQIDNLPLNGRSYLSLIDLTPGADGTRINGQWSDGNRFVLDGANNTTLLGATSAYVPNLDEIQEFSIDSHSSKADEGGFLGATISVATKSGTNQLRGDAFEFGRNNEWVARNPISDPPGVPFPPYHFNQYGVAVGGPVYFPKLYNGHNKTFFFFGFQRTTTTQQTYVYSRVPTADELNGNFQNSIFFLASPGIQHLYDPKTTTTGTNPTRAPFLNDQIPADRINTLAQAYMKAVLPSPNYVADANHQGLNRLDLFSAPTSNNDYSIRIDHRLGNKDSLWGRYSQVDNASTSYLTPEINQVESQDRKNLTIDWIHLFTPNLFIESNYSYQQFPLIINSGLPDNFTQTLTGLGFNSKQLSTYGVPSFNNTGVETPGITGHYEQGQTSPFSLYESLSWNIGNHNIKTGVNFSYKHYQNFAVGNGYGFSNVQTEDPNQNDPNAANTGLPFASALLGLPASTYLNLGNYTEAYKNWAVYAEDTWKLRPNLTIDIGLRYDNFPTPNFTQGEINDWDFNNGIWYIGGGTLPPPCSSSQGAPCIPGGSLANIPYGNMIQVSKYAGIRHPIHDNWGPRIGFAWSMFPNTVLRAGYGIYFDPESNTTQEDQNTFGTWPSSTNSNFNYNQIGTPLTYIDQLAAQVPSLQPAAAPWGTSGYFWDPAKKDPMSQQWNVDLQQQLNKDSVITISYVGSLSRDADMTLDANTALTPGPGDNSIVNARRKWPFYGTDTHFGTDLGRGNYNALQVKANRRFSGNVGGLLSYTWAKTMDNGSDAWYSGQPQNSYDVNADYGPSNSDRRQILTMAALYTLPFGKGQRWLNRGIQAYFGDWQLNAIGTVETGNPVVLLTSGDPANIGNTQYNYDRPNLVGNPYVVHPSGKQWFNQAAFQTPSYSYGNTPRGILYQPGYQNADLSIFKNTYLNEHTYLQLRMEAFNAFNLITRGPADGNVTNNPNFGQIHSIGSTPRQIQFGVKIYF